MAVIEMLKSIHAEGDDGTKFIEQAKLGNADKRLMGFGHRVYKHYDPRAKIIKESFYSALASLGIKDDPLLNIAMRLEEAALRDDLFSRAQAVSQCRFLFWPHHAGHWDSGEHVHRSCSPSAGCPGGSPIGRKWPPIRKAASTARARFTSARTSATTCRPTGGSEGETGQIGKAGNWKIGKPPSAFGIPLRFEFP